MEAIDELSDFIKPTQRLDVKALAIHHVLSLTGHFESRMLLISHKNMLENVITLAFKSDEQKSISKDAFLTLINLSADELNAKHLLAKVPLLVNLLIESICDETNKFSDTACAILSNLSRGKQNCETIAQYFNLSDDNNNNKAAANKTLESLLKVFCTENFNKSNSLNYLAPFICNLTQLEHVRTAVLKDNVILLRLLPYVSYNKSIIRRGGIVGAIKNCCFDYDYHEKLLFSPELDILSRLLLPLAGPEELDADEMDKLPEDLQYLPPTKERESDPDIRCMLLETIMILTSHKKCRDYLIEKNTYVIMRELHKWETDERARAACEKLVHLLISDEPERGMEDLHKVVIPEDLSQKFYQYEQEELVQNFNTTD